MTEKEGLPVEEQRSPPWGAVTKVIVTLLFLVLFGAVVYSFREALPPLIIACLLAYILTPIANALNTRGRLPRGLSTLIVYLALIGVIGLIVGWVAPLLVRRVTAFQVDVVEIAGALKAFLTQQYVIGDFTLDLTAFYVELQSELAALVRPAVTQTFALVVQAVTTGVWIIFIAVISFYLVKDGPRMGAQIEHWLPPRLRGDYRRLRTEISGIWRDFFRGQFLVGLAMGASILILMGAVGLPNIIVLSLLAVGLEFLPSLGHGIWLVIAIPFALFRGSLWLPIPNFWFAVVVLAIHGVLQQVDLNVYIPRIVGRRVHLHPLVVIVGIVLGGILAGVLGVFLAAPLISSLRLVFKYGYCKLLELDPWPKQEEGQPAMDTLSAPGWLQAVWTRVEERIRGESEPENPTASDCATE